MDNTGDPTNVKSKFLILIKMVKKSRWVQNCLRNQNYQNQEKESIKNGLCERNQKKNSSTNIILLGRRKVDLKKDFSMENLRRKKKMWKTKQVSLSLKNDREKVFFI